MLNGSRFYTLCLLSILLVSCNNKADKQKTENKTEAKLVDGHPEWIMQGNIYEVNLRQYTAEGTIAAFEKHLDRLKNMGVQTLWFMPIHPISLAERKGKMGSYYAVADYRGINPEYGTMEDWKSLVKKAHEMGFKVIIDWVPNHTGADHPWLTRHNEFYVKDSTGKTVSPFDWSDVKKLDYTNPALRDSMINSMKFWITETDIDGFRCDVAGELPEDFWKNCIDELKKTKPGIFMLAEAEKPRLHSAGFDATYPWDMFNTMKKIAAGVSNASALDSSLYKMDTAFPRNAIKMYFTSNHDENSWSKADYATMPGVKHAPFAVLTQTMVRSVPLIYSGQEEPTPDSISFFYKDTIEFSNLQRAAFYKTMLNLRRTNPALAANAKFTRLKLGNEKAVYAYTRSSGNNEVLVILNLSSEQQEINSAGTALKGSMTNVFTGRQEPVENLFARLNPWDYLVFSR
jgi:alpha-amylase